MAEATALPDRLAHLQQHCSDTVAPPPRAVHRERETEPLPRGEGQWRDIPGYEGIYEASSLGQVYSVLKDRALRPTLRQGYPTVQLWKDGRRRAWKVHRLVMLSFVGPLPVGLQTRHLNGDRTDAGLSNLAYGTAAENMQDAVRHGTLWMTRRTHCPSGHEYTPDNIMRNKAQPTARYCRECHRLRCARRTAKVRATRRGVA